MNIKEMPDEMPVDYLPVEIQGELKTEDWSEIAFRKGWTNERLGKEIVASGRRIYEAKTFLL